VSAEVAVAPLHDPASVRVAGNAQAVLLVDDDAVCVEASPGACRLLGASAVELAGRPLAQLFVPDGGERFAHVWDAFLLAGGKAGPFALAPPAPAIEVAISVEADVAAARHLVVLGGTSAVSGAAIEVPDGPVGDRLRVITSPPGRAPTVREREILALLAEGSTDTQIAEMLGLSPATVQTHVRNAKAKLGARTRAQAVVIALRRGLISV
jgi:DNA-binding CsgD family transcriptional regulator